MTAANHPMAWAEHGACRGEDQTIFFPDREPSTSRPWPDQLLEPARAICGPCPVFAACHRWAIEHETEGIWAATDPHGRRRLRRALGLADLGRLGDPARDDQIVGLVPPLEDGHRSSAEIARAVGVSQRTVIRRRAAARRTA